jgi:hypothetical protein
MTIVVIVVTVVTVGEAVTMVTVGKVENSDSGFGDSGGSVTMS